jgi:hypothetical protein
MKMEISVPEAVEMWDGLSWTPSFGQPAAPSNNLPPPPLTLNLTLPAHSQYLDLVKVFLWFWHNQTKHAQNNTLYLALWPYVAYAIARAIEK